MVTPQTLLGALMVLMIRGCLGEVSISGPLNVAGVIGITEQFVLQCSISPDVSLSFYSWSDSEGDIYRNEAKQQGHPRSENLDLDKPGISDQWTDYGLVVQTPVLNMAERYRCFAIDGQVSAAAAADVLLLEENPACYHNFTDDYEYQAGETARMVCSVNYTGSWPPEMTWYDGENIEIVDGVTHEIEDNYITYYLMLELDGESDEHTFVCKTRFPKPPSPGDAGQAMNAPTYEDNCSIKLSFNSSRGLVSNIATIATLLLLQHCYYLQ